ncbi:DUF5722 domain-containing protein [Microbacterium sp. KR10-403]|uniref:DUF5722 domain-containing protein n=1 Tax=Microbacterium sp. KR10-403 TaxID=3158581 RepID=UPI0032E3A868
MKRNKRPWARWGVPVSALTAMLLCLGSVAPAQAEEIPVPANGDAAAASIGISHVTVGADTITVTGTVPAGDAGATVTVTESGAQVSGEDGSAFGTATADADGGFSVTGPRETASGEDGLYDAFTASVDGAGVGTARFADALDFTSVNTDAYPDIADKKGLQVQMTDDAESLGVQHAALNVDLGTLMLNTQVSDDDIAFTSNGRTYYFDASVVEGLDTQIKALSDNGVLVNLILLVYRHDGVATSAYHQLGDPDASSADGAGPIVGFNMTTAEGVAYYTAAMEFIASRWTRPDQKYGQALGYIVGNEVDAQWAWANAGDKTVDEFVDSYSRALRITSLATRKYDAAARTYTSLDHNWTALSGSNPDNDNPTRYYSSKQIVDALTTASQTSGDFPWDVAFHPYPQNLFDPAFWNDTQATEDFDTPLITFKNIEVLTEYLQQSDLEYQGEQRRVILSEQGCNTPGAGDSLTEDAEKLQAACFAYAYYKIRFSDGIDAFILHRHVDHRQEGGLNLGLWTADYSTTFPATPLKKKYIYDVYKYIDTARSLEVTDFAKKIIGISDWSDVIPGFDASKLDQRAITQTVGARVDARTQGASSLGRFSRGVDGWAPSDNASTATVTNGVLHVGTQSGTFASQYRGVVKDFGTRAPNVSGQWLTARVRIPSATHLGAETVVELTATLASGQKVEGQGRIAADGSFHTVALRVPKQRGATLDTLKVRVRGTGSAQPDATFDVASVATARSVGSSRRTNVLVSAGVASADLIGTTLSVTVTNLDSEKLHGTASVRADCGDYAVVERRVRLPKTAFGASSTVDFTVTGATADASTACVVVDGTAFTVPVVVPPPVDHLLYDFESDASGWVAGDATASVARVTSMANGPGAPKEGSGMLQANATASPATTPHVISVTPDEPIDLGDAASVHLWGDSYGGAPGATGYVMTFTLTGEDGTTRTVTDADFTPDSWNQLVVDVSDWSGRSAVVSMSVSFAAVGSTYPTWNPSFQIDGIGFFTS